MDEDVTAPGTASRGDATCGPGSAPHAPLRRVLYVVSQFPSLSETFIVREIRTLLESGVDVRILSLKRAGGTSLPSDVDGLMERAWPPAGLREGLSGTLRTLATTPRILVRALGTVVADTWRQPDVLLKSIVAVFRALGGRRQLDAFAPEFIHAHWSTYPTTAAWLLSRVTGRPFGFTCHAHDVFVNRHFLPRKIEDAALAVTISRHNVDWLAANVSPIARGKMEVVHCGVDLRQVRWQPDGRTGDLIVGVGRLAPEKGFETLVEALALLRDQGMAFQCRVIGDGPGKPALESLIARRRLQDLVTLAGALPQPRVRDALGEAGVFALPCQVAPNGSRDGIPVALMEAMASGCAVVSCPVSGVPELVVDGVHGLLAAEHDAVSLAHALKRLLRDAPLRRRLAVAARERIELEFDAGNEGRRLHGLMARATADAT
ncbi:glycosyltransferase family 4 protein [Luteimonas pelagia]